MDRRDFVRSAGAAALLTSLGFSLQSCESDGDDVTPTPPATGGGSGSGSGGTDDDVLFTFTLTDAPFDVLQTSDAWLLHPTEDYLLVNVGGSLRAFTSICTHSGCSRDWSFANKQARCTCHNSIFNNDGSVSQGPASGSLAEFAVETDNNTITVKK